jgi:CHAD domain-containing protein
MVNRDRGARLRSAIDSEHATLQDELGDLNDAVFAERWLQSWARGSRSMPGVFPSGELAGKDAS